MGRYDVFKTTSDGSPYWIGTAETLENAKQVVEGLNDCSGADQYFVRDSRDGVTLPISASVGKLSRRSTARSDLPATA